MAVLNKDEKLELYDEYFRSYGCWEEEGLHVIGKIEKAVLKMKLANDLYSLNQEYNTIRHRVGYISLKNYLKDKIEKMIKQLNKL